MKTTPKFTQKALELQAAFAAAQQAFNANPNQKTAKTLSDLRQRDKEMNEFTEEYKAILSEKRAAHEKASRERLRDYARTASIFAKVDSGKISEETAAQLLSK